jgi:hypothetical protein
MQHIQQFCGADDNPRIRKNTGDPHHRDPYLTHVFDPTFNRGLPEFERNREKRSSSLLLLM